MTAVVSFSRKVWWLIHKDLCRECRARMTWPAVLLFGLLLVLTLELQMDLPETFKQRVEGGLLWLSIFIAGTLALERSFGDEQDEGCWDALRMYPIPPAAVFVAKTAFNFLTVAGAAALLTLLFVVITDARLANHLGATLAVTVIASLGLAAIGTLVGATTNTVRKRGNLVALLLLPLVWPVVLGAGEATRLAMAGDFAEPFWRWLKLLSCFDVIFITLGVLLFDIIMED